MNYTDLSGHFLVSTAVLVGVGIGGIIGAVAGSYKGRLAAKDINNTINKVSINVNKVHHIIQNKHAWKTVAKKNQWKYVKPILKKAMKQGKMQAIGKTKNKEIVYKFMYTYKGKVIEGTCVAKKGMVKLADAWVKTFGI